jgi:hypothetical protein
MAEQTIDNQQKVIALKVAIFDVIRKQNILEQDLRLLETHKQQMIIELEKVESDFPQLSNEP